MANIQELEQELAALKAKFAEFVHGDENTTVVNQAGAYPSFAKAINDNIVVPNSTAASSASEATAKATEATTAATTAATKASEAEEAATTATTAKSVAVAAFQEYGEPTAWAPDTAYTKDAAMIIVGNLFYVPTETHTSGASFSADLIAGKWRLHQGLDVKTGVGRVDTFADLRATVPKFVGQTVDIVGHTVAGVGGGTFVAKKDVNAVDDGGVIAVVAGGDGWYWERRLAESLSCEMFGWPYVEAGVCASAAISAASKKNVGLVTYNAPHLLQTTPIYAKTGVVLKGPGGMGAEIRVADGVELESQYMTENFNTIYQLRPRTESQGVVSDAGFDGVWFNGNRENRSVPTDWRDGLAVKCYWMRPKIRDSVISRSAGMSFVSAYYGSTNPSGYSFWNDYNMESDIVDRGVDSLYIYDSGFEGFVWEGPADSTIDRLFVGWSAGVADFYRAGQTPVNNPLARSLKFKTGGIKNLLLTSGGSGYTTATVSIAGSGSGATADCVIDNGEVVAVFVIDEGFDYDDSTTVSISGDGSGATATALIDNTVDSVVFNNRGAEIGYIHSFNNPDGIGINFRSDSDEYPRYKASFLMSESSLGCVKIGQNVRMQMVKIDTHNNQLHGGVDAHPALLIRTKQGGALTNFDDLRKGGADSSLSPSLELGGEDVVISAGKIACQGRNVEAVKMVGGIKQIKTHVTGSAGSAITTYGDMQCANVDITSDKCKTAWENRSGNHVSGVFNVSARAYFSDFDTQFIGLDGIPSRLWRTGINLSLSDLANTATTKASSDSVSGVVDCSITTAQTIVIPHNCVRTPKLEDCFVNVNHNSSAISSAKPASVAKILSASSEDVTVQVKFSEAGSGTASVKVSIA